MSIISKALGVLAATGLFVATPAIADYAIMEDPAFPSVIYFEFEDDGTLPQVISAPAGPPTVVITSPTSTTTNNGGGDPALPVEVDVNVNDGHGGDISLEDQRLNDFANMTPAQIEQAAEQNVIDAEILDRARLR